VEKRVLAVILGALIAAVIAGCGGGDEGSSSDSPTKAEFARQANAACKKAEVARGKLVQAALRKMREQGATKSLQEKLVVTLLPPYDKLVRELQELGAPEGEEAKVEGVIGTLEETIARAREKPYGAVTGKVFVDYNKVTADYGLKECKI
jgi:hypothetical protein